MAVSKDKMMLLPILPLRGQVVYPHVVLHFDVSRKMSIAALERAMQNDQRIFLVSQKDEETETPGFDDLSLTGTVAVIRQIMNLPGECLRVMAEGEIRGRIVTEQETEPCMTAVVRSFADKNPRTKESRAAVRVAWELFEEYARKGSRVSVDTALSVRNVNRTGELADVIASNMPLRTEEKQQLLDETDPSARLEKISTIIARETEMIDLEKQVQARVRKQVDQNQKDYYLREQLKAIHTELGDDDELGTSELRKRMDETPLNEEAREKCGKEIERLGRMAPGSPEAAVSQTYIEWILDLPWGKETEDNLDLKRAREVLDKDHYGLEKVKERIIEYLAVLRVKQDMKGPILCFVGPPGVGKTSVVRAVAEAVGRRFVQMSLGGVRDEAEIRGHRRTYIGAIPGRIISGLKQAGTMNPVFLFDEIDKMGNDYRGDPASSMLEVLDAEQNNAFRDHYMELPFDLSKVMFITTANTTDSIPPALLDRLEIIEVPSYTEEEKLQILRNHLLPRQIAAHGLKPRSVRMNDDVMRAMIEGYTREAGVRTLERTTAMVIRKAVVEMLENEKNAVTVSAAKLGKYLGAVRYLREAPEQKASIGVVNGLAYTTVGGEMLQVECALMPGKGTLKLTGQLGDVMKESAETAFSWVRAHSEELGLKADFWQDRDIHIHVPEGAVPKDGPSAGVTMATALVSAFAASPVRQDAAMTGEITLRGRVLPIGGLKEKTLAAFRAGIRTLIIPKENHKDLEEIPGYVLERFTVVEAETIGDVLKTALIKE
ncbi:MAG: endopeptidase La [Clostridia bacterium]|nr:endopeptidase La [Clostridia bacterium]